MAAYDQATRPSGLGYGGLFRVRSSRSETSRKITGTSASGLVAIREARRRLKCQAMTETVLSRQRLAGRDVLTNYEEGILLNAGLLAAAQLLRDVAGQLAERYEWEVSTGIDEGAHISYRISAEGGKLRGEMIGLARFIEEGHRRGLDAEFFFSCQYALDAFPVETTQMTQKPVALKQLVRP